MAEVEASVGLRTRGWAVAVGGCGCSITMSTRSCQLGVAPAMAMVRKDKIIVKEGISASGENAGGY
jgi:hypothetical protein